MIAASTPSGKREEFYKWCVNATKTYKPKQEDIDNFKFTDYIIEMNDKGNGWVQIFSPSVVNKNLLDINPDTDRTYLEDLKYELSELRYEQEVMAGFGEEELGIYQKRFIDAAIEEGRRMGYTYMDHYTREEVARYKQVRRMNKIILGVDWDKYSACTNFVCVEYDRMHVNAWGSIEPKFKILYRVEIPRSKFTYVEAVDKIIQLNDIWDFDYIAVDRGYGEVQIELLHKYGGQNPGSGLAEKVVGYHFSQKIPVHDPHTMQREDKPLKPFMVNNSVVVFENKKIILNPDDTKFIEDLEGYRLKGRSSTGQPIFSDENEHTIDAMNLCMLIFEQNHGVLFKDLITTSIYPIEGLNPDNIEIVDRRVKIEEKEEMIIPFGNNGVLKVMNESKGKGRAFKRSKF